MCDVHSALEFEYLTGASIGDDAEDILLGAIAASDLPLSGELAEREISHAATLELLADYKQLIWGCRAIEQLTTGAGQSNGAPPQ